MDMNFNHADTSPPKVYGETEHAGPSITSLTISSLHTTPSGSETAPYDPKQEVPYKAIKRANGNGIFTGISTTTDGQAIKKGNGIFTGFSTTTDGQVIDSNKSGDKKSLNLNNATPNNQNSNEQNSLSMDDKKCKENKICGTNRPNTDPDSPYSINITHRNNSPKSDADKP
jgi:hypothetical protein